MCTCFCVNRLSKHFSHSRFNLASSLIARTVRNFRMLVFRFVHNTDGFHQENTSMYLYHTTWYFFLDSSLLLACLKYRRSPKHACIPVLRSNASLGLMNYRIVVSDNALKNTSKYRVILTAIVDCRMSQAAFIEGGVFG